MVYEAKSGATSFQENMEALKHNFLLRGFFNKRGYFDSSELGKHAVARLPRGAPVRQFTFEEKDLFDKPATAKLRKEKLLNQVGSALENNPWDRGSRGQHRFEGSKGRNSSFRRPRDGRTTIPRSALQSRRLANQNACGGRGATGGSGRHRSCYDNDLPGRPRGSYDRRQE